MWHDEYKCPVNGSYVHGVLLIPVDRKREIVAYLEKTREVFGYKPEQKIGYSGSLDTDKRAEFLRNNLSLAAHALKVKIDPPQNLYKVDGKMRYEKTYEPFVTIPGDKPFNLKSGLLVVPDNHADMSGWSYSTKVEITLRFCIKGLCHWAFDEKKPVNITKLVFDGIEHHGRDFYLERIIGRNEWRRYVEICPVEIDDRQRDARKDETAYLMDFTDMILGSFYNKLYFPEKKNHSAFSPIDPIIERMKNGNAGKQVNSKWYKSVTVSELRIKDGKFDFHPIEFYQSPMQLNLGIS